MGGAYFFVTMTTESTFLFDPVPVESVATLFRSSSLATMLMDQYMKQTADTYLRTVLEDTIKQILESQDACEVGVVMKGCVCEVGVVMMYSLINCVD